MTKNAESRPGLADLHHNNYRQAQEKALQAKAAWSKPPVFLPGLRQIPIFGQNWGNHRPQSRRG
jgi:hypothetical protein